ncbi:methyltransferase domain-containing protein [Marinicauda algicola]|uniref:Methyltransferase domain-containing protein n=1 Tax=Marinicauda algicola TaxID=2029849 RepID=A0A4S2H2Y0_9PROT|nr:methyltransferase domain-containing protein [Marinicauda algicola]TGY89904.1 methyltransferase domain-containing protein [Marinicauda algicola]
MSGEEDAADRDYVIGVNEAEIARLGTQHAVWRETALKAWSRAGLKPAMAVADIGCGPGYAALDLAAAVGPQGRVIGVDQSRTFLKVLRERAAGQGLSNVETVESDLAHLDLAPESLDMIFVRWVLSFVPEPEAALARMVRALKPGGAIVLQEYGCYRTFRVEPHEPVLDRFLDAVEASWKAGGGDANVARRLPGALVDAGCEVAQMTPLVFAAQRGEPFYTWPLTWIRQAPDRMAELGFLTAQQARDFHAWLGRVDAAEHSWLTTPMVLEIIARKC